MTSQLVPTWFPHDFIIYAPASLTANRSWVLADTWKKLFHTSAGKEDLENTGTKRF